MKCPRDQSELVRHSMGAGELLVCEKCHGMWIRMEHFRSLVPTENSTGSAESVDEAISVKGRKHPPVMCPEGCHDLMTQRELHGIQVDICYSHMAFWLDGGEYDLIVEIHRAKNKIEQNNGTSKINAGEMVLDAVSGFDVILDVAEGGVVVTKAVLGFILEVLETVG